MGPGICSETKNTSSSAMWSLILYILAVVVGLLLFMLYEPEDEKDPEMTAVDSVRRRSRKKNFRLSSLFGVVSASVDGDQDADDFKEHFHSLSEISDACSKAGLGKSNLIIGIDFTASNEWQGRKSFSGSCLHKTVGDRVYNPYQKVISILGQALAPFTEENLIPAYGFGDSVTCDEDVFSFSEDESPCHGFQQVLDRYNEIVKSITLGGPTSFAPIIMKSIQIVKETRKYHILVIVADGQVTEEGSTIEAIVEASNHPISIIVVGVGDGPWRVMEEFDHRLPKRKFDNFRFVDYYKTTSKAKNPDTAFALQTLMEIPDQYKWIKSLGYLKEDSQTADSPEHMEGSASFQSSNSLYRDVSAHSSPSGSPKSQQSVRSSCNIRRRVLSERQVTPV
ncbi:hypothetical protein LSH36_57g02041 [Paralvinella palmiformis]|uniref:VWFA domain-containing protein n=1 Tax=Paralvinella palmiformis TaxID=53620 RepID=A0AAD9NF53_9ANNE|nr:hypothetical protein LSH36_57g02041 [Paralvinella palmiformis]